MEHLNANDGIRQFAKAGITATITINSGASIALLTQAETLLDIGAGDALGFAISTWAWGVSTGTVAWIFAFLAASAFANEQKGLELHLSLMGIFAFLWSIGCFLTGALSVGRALQGLAW